MSDTHFATGLRLTGVALFIAAHSLDNYGPRIYGWFTGGFHNRDLKEAKTLLDVLLS